MSDIQIGFGDVDDSTDISRIMQFAIYINFHCRTVICTSYMHPSIQRYDVGEECIAIDIQDDLQRLITDYHCDSIIIKVIGTINNARIICMVRTFYKDPSLKCELR